MTTTDQIEILINIGYGKAYDNHFPNRYPDGLIRRNERELIGFHLAELDKLGVNWTIQNNALQFINMHDTQKAWDCFYQNSFRTLAKKLLAGATFEELTRERKKELRK